MSSSELTSINCHLTNKMCLKASLENSTVVTPRQVTIERLTSSFKLKHALFWVTLLFFPEWSHKTSHEQSHKMTSGHFTKRSSLPFFLPYSCFFIKNLVVWDWKHDSQKSSSEDSGVNQERKGRRREEGDKTRISFPVGHFIDTMRKRWCERKKKMRVGKHSMSHWSIFNDKKNEREKR